MPQPGARDRFRHNDTQISSQPGLRRKLHGTPPSQNRADRAVLFIGRAPRCPASCPGASSDRRLSTGKSPAVRSYRPASSCDRRALWQELARTGLSGGQGMTWTSGSALGQPLDVALDARNAAAASACTRPSTDALVGWREGCCHDRPLQNEGPIAISKGLSPAFRLGSPQIRHRQACNYA